MKYSTFIRQESIARGGVPNLGDMLKRGSGTSAFRETFPAARPGSVRWIEAGSGMMLADVLKAMLRKSGDIGFSIAFHQCLWADILCGIFTMSISIRQSLAAS